MQLPGKWDNVNWAIADYVAMLQNAVVGGEVETVDPSQLRLEMTSSQQARYVASIESILKSQGHPEITPSVLFDSAVRAVSTDVSTVSARIGLQPGTMDPVHYGHISASLSAIVTSKLNLVLLAVGGNVPEKPYAADSSVRYEMARLAAREKRLAGWLYASRIRQQTSTIFSNLGRGRFSFAIPREPRGRNALADIGAFVWLFTANPRVTWKYLVGLDKVVAYGRKHERRLAETFADTRSNVQIVYFSRPGHSVNLASDIAPYDWLLRLWRGGFITESSVTSLPLSATEIRRALAQEKDHVDGVPLAECVCPEVLAYIESSDLLNLYKRERS